MKGHLTIADIEKFLLLSEAEFSGYAATLSDEQFFHQPAGKWSPAQQVKHLVVAANSSRPAFTLPLFLVRLVGGKANRPSRTYDELVAKYKAKLEQGGRASGRFVPKPIPAQYGKEKLLHQFTTAMQKIAAAIKNRTEAGLDNYVIPHPLLGKITLRELGYFTIYHTHHHLQSIRAMTGKQVTD